MTLGSNQIAVGILGLGRSGWNIHAMGLKDHPDYRIAAVADPVAERRKEAEETFGCATYETPQGVIQDPNVELVVVATPSHTHVPLSKEALVAGKHVVVEKPMAESAREVDELIEAAQAAGRLITCYQPRRFDPDFLKIREWIDAGRIGRIVLVRRGTYVYQRRADWQMLRKFGGGELSNTGPHLIDQVLLLLGEGKVDVWADLQHTIGAGDAEDHVKVVLKSESGATADVEITRCCAIGQRDWVIMGTYGTIVSEKGTLQLKYCDPSRLPELQVDEGPAAGRKYGTGEQIEWMEETYKPVVAVKPVTAFYNFLYGSIREGKPLHITPASVRRQIEVIERARIVAGYK